MGEGREGGKNDVSDKTDDDDMNLRKAERSKARPADVVTTFRNGDRSSTEYVV